MPISLLLLVSFFLYTTAAGTASLEPRDQSSSTEPLCFYDLAPSQSSPGGKECGSLWTNSTTPPVGSPNPEYCKQSTLVVCAGLSQPPPALTNATNNTSVGSPLTIAPKYTAVAYQTGTNAETGTNSDCFATASTGLGAVRSLDFSTCMSEFESVAGCSLASNDNYNPLCVGGWVNVEFSNGQLVPVDYSQPSFAIGVSAVFDLYIDVANPWNSAFDEAWTNATTTGDIPEVALEAESGLVTGSFSYAEDRWPMGRKRSPVTNKAYRRGRMRP